tara:strand:- start:35687 stop:38095 length:2409 start_codon:yes stop_codon:yes gene_type:complete
MQHRTTIEKVSISASAFAITHVDGLRLRIRQKPEGPALVAGDEVVLYTLKTVSGFVEPEDWQWCDPDLLAADEAKREILAELLRAKQAVLANLEKALPLSARIQSIGSGQRGLIVDPQYGELVFGSRACEFSPEEGDEVVIESVKGDLASHAEPLEVLGLTCPAKPPWTNFGSQYREYGDDENHDDGRFGAEFARWAMETERSAEWIAIVKLCRTTSEKSKPGKRWLREGQALVQTVGEHAFVARLVDLIPRAPLDSVRGALPRITDAEQDLLKGLMWMCQGLSGEELVAVLGQLADRCFKKVPEIGEASVRVGNACVNTLGTLRDGAGIAHLSRLLGKVRTISARRTINKALNAAAESTGQTREDLEELAVPTFGLTLEGSLQQTLGDFTAELAIEDGTAALRWIKANGKIQKSVPKAVKEDHAEALRDIKRKHKELGVLLAAQPSRLERLWICDRRMTVAQLGERYLQHPVVAGVARRLLWLVETSDDSIPVLWRDGALRGLGGQPVAISDGDEARLLHLLDLDHDTLAVWRDDLDELGLVQPIPQLWREVYKPESKSLASELAAGHIIHQQGFRSMCQRREWRYGLQGRWDGDEEHASRSFAEVSATFEVEPIEYGHDYEYAAEYLVTGAVVFYASDNPEQRIPTRDVPPLIYSEVIRDVDMFVSHCTIINDASFNAAEVGELHSAYWNNNNWAPLTGVHRTRSEVLRRTLPRTILRECATVEEPALLVSGPAGTFQIHIGSTKVRREGDDSFLTVPVDKEAKKQVLRVFLPFEGDNMLAEALAKAFYLAECETLPAAD